MSSEAKVGTFVIVAIIIFVYTFISVANVQLGGENVTYRAYFTSAAGLDPGTRVRFGGLKAGVVSDVRPFAEDPTRVEVIFQMGAGIPVNADSVAKAASLSALGDKYLEVSTGSNEAARIEPGGVVPSEEALTLDDLTAQISQVSQQAQVLMKDVQENFNRLTGRAEVLMENLTEMTSEKNQKSFEQVLENTNLLVAEQRPKFDKITDQVSEMLEKVDILLDDIQKVARTADTTIANVNRTVEDTREPLKRDLEEMEATLKETRRLIAGIQAVVVLNEENINETLENIRVSSENIEQLTDELRQRPWSLIRIKPKEDRRVPVGATR